MKRFSFVNGMFRESRLCRFSMEAPGHDVPEQRTEAKEQQEAVKTPETTEKLASVDAAVERTHGEIKKIRDDGVVFQREIKKVDDFRDRALADLKKEIKLDLPGAQTA